MNRILCIHRNGVTKVNPQACKHEHTVIIHTGRQYTIQGEAADNMDCYQQCLDCGQVMRDDRTWGSTHSELNTSEIPY